jgi:hypothetical protein
MEKTLTVSSSFICHSEIFVIGSADVGSTFVLQNQ